MTEPIHQEYLENAKAPARDAASLTALSEDRALAQLKQRNLAIDAIEEIARNSGLMKSRKVRMLLAAHCHAPPTAGIAIDQGVLHFRSDAVRSAAGDVCGFEAFCR